MVAAAIRLRLSFGATEKNMAMGIMLVVVMVSPVVLCIAAFVWIREDWLKGFAEVARFLGRPM